MTHDKPEPPDMRGDAVTLRQKIQDRIAELESDRDLSDGVGSSKRRIESLYYWCNGSIHALDTVLNWLDEQEDET